MCCVTSGQPLNLSEPQGQITQNLRREAARAQMTPLPTWEAAGSVLFPRLVHQWGLHASPCFVTSWLCGPEQGFDLPQNLLFLIWKIVIKSGWWS